MIEMKCSGEQWLGEIPSSWKMERLQWHITEIKENNTPIKTTNVLSLTNKLGVIPYEQKGNQGNVAKENYDEYKLAYPGTIVANSMNILIGSVGICNFYGCVSPVYYVYKPNNGENLRFLNYIFQLEQFQKELRRYANGILEIRLRVSSNNIVKRMVAFPPLEEQELIADYLDKKISKIDSLIANQQQQIEKLKQYKQSLINEVVTKGLDRNVPMKDSGVESIGKIPCTWQILRTKFVASSLQKGNGITKDEVFIDGDIQCIRYGEIYTKYSQSFSETVSKTKLTILSNPQFIKHGDILFAGTGELIEEIGKNVVYLGDNPCVAGGDIIVMKHNEEPRFMNYVLNADCSQKQKSKGKAKLKVVHISATAIGDVMVSLPDKDTQINIANYLDEKCRIIDKLTDKKEIKIDKLNQYKKSLIYEYVTGKKRVPEA